MEETKWTNIQIDSQVLSTLMDCPCKVDYKFNRHLVPIGGVSKSIQKGQLAHIGARVFWQSRIENDEWQVSTVKALSEAKRESIKFENLEADDALDCYNNLLQFFDFQRSSNWMPLATEKHFKFLAFEDESIYLRIYLTGRIDLIMRSPQVAIFPIDLKSESERWFYSSLSNQFRIYALACKVNRLGVQRFGFQKTLEPQDKFKMEVITWDPEVLEEFRTITLPYWCKQYLIYNEEGYWPRNHSSCIHGHFACEFSDKYNNGGICAISPSVREQKLERYFTIGEEWNPEVF